MQVLHDSCATPVQLQYNSCRTATQLLCLVQLSLHHARTVPRVESCAHCHPCVVSPYQTFSQVNSEFEDPLSAATLARVREGVQALLPEFMEDASKADVFFNATNEYQSKAEENGHGAMAGALVAIREVLYFCPFCRPAPAPLPEPVLEGGDPSPLTSGLRDHFAPTASVRPQPFSQSFCNRPIVSPTSLPIAVHCPCHSA